MVTLPKPDQSELQEIYRRVYAYGAHLPLAGEKQFRARRLAALVACELPTQGNPRILEIGCMHGFLLKSFRDLGITAEGIELDKSAVEYCRAAGLTATATSIEEFDGNQDYNCVVMSHVFEHLLEPDVILTKLKRILKPEGVICLAVPNSEARLARWCSRYWGWWQVPVHVNHFTAESLKRMLATNGYQVNRTFYRGGDSLMLLLCGANAAGVQPSRLPAGWLQTKLISVASRLLRYWYFAGDDELIVVGRCS